MKYFYDTPCNIYTKWTEVVRGSLVEKTAKLYENIKCAIYNSSKHLSVTQQATETDANWMTMVLDCKYSWVHIWDIVEIYWVYYKVLYEPIAHYTYKWVIDNFELWINRTTEDVQV